MITTMAPQRILAVKLADLGDLLSVTPALRALRNAYPRAWIAALVTPGSASLLAGSDLVDAVLPFDKSAFDRPVDAARSLAAALALGRRLRAFRCDALALFHHLTTPFGTAKYAALALGSGAPVRAGLDNGRGWFLNRRVRDDGFGARHEADYWLAVATALGGHNAEPRLELPLRAEHHTWAEAALHARGLADRSLLAVHPGSGAWSLARRWRPERFAAVARHLADAHGLSPLVIAGPAPGERELAARVVAQIERPSGALDDAPDPLHLAAVLARCRLFLGNDSGPMHLAAALQRPIVAVFGPSNDRAWGPYPPDSPRHAVVRLALGCAPCIHRGHEFGTPGGCRPRPCLELLTVERVLAAAEQVLARTAAEGGGPAAAATVGRGDDAP